MKFFQIVPYQRKGHGFTLLELLITIVIFSFISIGCYQLLKSVTDNQILSMSLGKALSKEVRARAIVQKDLSQLVSRPIRDRYGETQSAFRAEPARGIIEFTRSGWTNFTGENRSELQRVAYELRQGKWIRRYWYHLDRSSEPDSIEQILMTDISSIEFQFLDNQSRWSMEWPPVDASSQNGLVVLPVAVAVEITRVNQSSSERWIFRGPKAIEKQSNNASGSNESTDKNASEVDKKNDVELTKRK